MEEAEKTEWLKNFDSASLELICCNFSPLRPPPLTAEEKTSFLKGREP